MFRNSKVNPERLREARLYRRITMEDLANAVQINKQAISQFENGKAMPEPTTLQKIASVLDFPYAFFYESDGNILVGNTYFRALYSSSKKDQIAQKIKAKYLGKVFFVLSTKGGVRFKPLNLPHIDYECSVEGMSMLARRYWGLEQEPILNMVNLLERNGIIVGEFSTEGNKIDAFYQYCEIEGNPTFSVILGTDKKSFYRRQFNCAHELAHILLHERYEDFSEITREEYQHRENEANAFAAAFLLPKEAFSKDVSVFPNRLSHYIELKKKWGVAITAMVMRARNLDIITSNQYTYLMRQISAKGYRTQEPLDDLIEYKHPRALRQAIDGLMLQKGLTGAKIASLFSSSDFSIPVSVLCELLDLDKNILQEKHDNNIVSFPPDRMLPIT